MFALTRWALIRAGEDRPSGVVALSHAALPLWRVLLKRLAACCLAWPGSACSPPRTGHAALRRQASWPWDLPRGACATLSAPRFKFTGLPLMALAMQMMLSGGFLLAPSCMPHEWQGFSQVHVSRPSAIAFRLLVLRPGVAGCPACNWLLETIDPALAPAFACVNPVAAIILGWAAAGDPLTLNTLLPPLLLVIGAVFIARAQGRPAARQAAAGSATAARTHAAQKKEPLQQAA